MGQPYEQYTAREATDAELLAVVADGARLIEELGSPERLNRIDALVLASCRVEARNRGLV